MDYLAEDVWFPYYLPHWSSRAASRATWSLGDGELRLSIPADQGLWCADTHPTPLRVSCLQSGNITGAQPFREGLRVTEQQDEFRGLTPVYGQIAVRARGVITPRSMVAFWLSGIEDVPAHSGEICVMEVFGDAPTAVGMGLHQFRDTALIEDFAADPLPIDIAEFHTYGVDWRPGSLTFTVDGAPVKHVGRSPDYPVQLMLGVFDFPDKGGPLEVPELIVTSVTHSPL